MQILFQFFYGIHPLLPMAYLLLLATGLLAPALYCAARKIPYSIAVIWSRSKAAIISRLQRAGIGTAELIQIVDCVLASPGSADRARLLLG